MPAAVAPTVQYVQVSNVELLHRRLGHPGRSATKQLVTLQNIPSGADAQIRYHCSPCLVGKATQAPRGLPIRTANRCLEHLSYDLMGPLYPAGRSGKHYLLVVTDECSDYAQAIPLVFKSSSVDAAYWLRTLRDGKVNLQVKVHLPEALKSRDNDHRK